MLDESTSKLWVEKPLSVYEAIRKTHRGATISFELIASVLGCSRDDKSYIYRAMAYVKHLMIITEKKFLAPQVGVGYLVLDVGEEAGLLDRRIERSKRIIERNVGYYKYAPKALMTKVQKAELTASASAAKALWKRITGGEDA